MAKFSHRNIQQREKYVSFIIILLLFVTCHPRLWYKRCTSEKPKFVDLMSDVGWCVYIEKSREHCFWKYFRLFQITFVSASRTELTQKHFRYRSGRVKMPSFTTDTMYKECLKCTLWDGEKSENFCCILLCSRQPINILSTCPQYDHSP